MDSDFFEIIVNIVFKNKKVYTKVCIQKDDLSNFWLTYLKSCIHVCPSFIFFEIFEYPSPADSYFQLPHLWSFEFCVWTKGYDVNCYLTFLSSSSSVHINLEKKPKKSFKGRQ